MKRGSNRFAMNFRKAGSQEAYTPGSASASANPGQSALASPPTGPPPTSPAKKKSRFARAAEGAAQSAAVGSAQSG